LILRAKRGYRDFDNTRVVKYDSLCGFLFMGWFLHYFPFFLMSRQLFLHHYFPALYFAILLSCAVFDLLTSALRPRIRLQIAAVLIILAIWHFQHFAPLAYGSPWTKAKCESARWVKTWDFSCNDFYEDYSMYNPVPSITTPQNPVPVATVGGEPGGRAPVVVVDDNAAANQDQQHTSTLIGGQAAPGHDIFNQPKKEIKSEDSVPKVEAAAAGGGDSDEPSRIVSVVAPPEQVGKQDDSQRDVGPTSTDQAQVEGQVQEANEAKDSGKKNGPLGEAEAEAEKVAQELFPDAVGA